MSQIVAELAPTGVLRAGINMSNFLLVTGKTASGDPQGVSPDMAAEIARQNYDYRVEVESSDELGRLATTFNGMCESIQHAREDLTRQERISTIGRLSTSIVHDLRNPLAAIYAGSEMLVDGKLPPPQVQRLATNIYRASRLIQEMLQQLLNASRGRTGTAEICSVGDVISAAWSSVEAAAESRSVTLISDDASFSSTFGLPARGASSGANARPSTP